MHLLDQQPRIVCFFRSWVWSDPEPEIVDPIRTWARDERRGHATSTFAMRTRELLKRPLHLKVAKAQITCSSVHVRRLAVG